MSWLTAPQLDKLALAMSVSGIEKRGIIFDHKDDPERTAYILLAGVARISCRNRKGQRALMMMVRPGMIPGLPQPAAGVSYHFRCEAVSNCEVGTLAMEALIRIALGVKAGAFQQMADNCVGRWGAAQSRCLNFMSFTLGERLALTLLELSDDFGTREARGTRLRVAARHKDLAELVGASRPRVSEQMIEFERMKMISRGEGRLIVRCDELQGFLLDSHPALRQEVFA
ncbi:MAG: Crp/Fnr family transcriptional regulator [Steroidobacteraceae bacterium]